MRRRYSNLYVPSDFFHSQIRWSESFPPHAPFSIQKPCAFHVFHKSVANPNAEEDAVLDPPDADSSFSAKVIFQANLSLTTLIIMFLFVNHLKGNVNGCSADE